MSCLSKSSFNHLKQINCPLIDINPREKVTQIESGNIHSDCQLDDICDCQPFNSCPRCAKKTEWKPIKEMIKTLELYWLLDKNNNTAEGYLAEDLKTISIIKSENENFGIPIMFAEIKPPKTP